MSAAAQAAHRRRGRTAGRGAQHHLRNLGLVRAGAGAAAACAALADRPPGRIPVIGPLFKGPPFGIGILTASVVLAIMVLPFIAATMRDVFDTVPPMLKESGYGLGATTWEVIWNVVVPHSRAGMVGGIMLGLGRALGETMAVTFVIGNAHRISSSLLAPGTTISSSIANEFTEAVGDLYTSSLIALGLLLFFITFTVIAAAQAMLYRLERSQGAPA